MWKYVDMVTAILLIIGGLNWGFVGVFSFNLVSFFLGGTMFEMLVYALIGLSAFYYGARYLKDFG